MSANRHLKINSKFEPEAERTSSAAAAAATAKSENLPARVLFAWDYLEWGGAQIYFLAIMKGIKEHCEVKAVLPKGSNEQLLKFLDNLNVPVEEFDAHGDLKPAPTFRRKIERHYNKLRSEYVLCRHLEKMGLKRAVVHIEFGPWQSLAALFWLSARTRVFTTVHNSVYPAGRHRRWSWKVKFAILSRMKNFHIFAANEDAKKCLREFVPPEFYERIKVTYASVNPAEIEAARAAEIDRTRLEGKFGIPPGKFLIFCVGQFIDRKGRWIFLEAARKLAEKYSDVAFVWISNSKPGAEELKKAEAYGLDERFVLITSDQVGTERDDLFRLMRLADVFALPSYVEGLPISLLEAMALGVPCVSTRVNGIPEAVKHLETGLLIEAGDAGKLIEAIENLKNNKPLREKVAAAGREFVLRNFDERRTAKIAWESYKEAFRA
jgi:glycosyltransferase involved in cell wall biosynthesis